MYAQIVRGAVREDAWGRLQDLTDSWCSDHVERGQGFRALHFMREVNSDDGVIFILFWESKELASKAGRSPETDAYFKQLMELVVTEPVFVGAETVSECLAAS